MASRVWMLLLAMGSVAAHGQTVEQSELTAEDVARRCAVGPAVPKVVAACVDRQVAGLDSGAGASLAFDAFRAMQDISPAHAAALQRNQEASSAARTERELSAGRRRCGKSWPGYNWPQLGMTAKAVIDCGWGQPSRINRDIDARGISEQWVYPTLGYVYLRNGIVVTIQERSP